MMITEMMSNPRWVCTMLSIAGATAFYTVKKLTDRDYGVTEDNQPVYNNHLRAETTFNVLKMKSPEVNPFSGNPLD